MFALILSIPGVSNISAGAYTVSFRTDNLPAGLYFYQLRTATQTLMKSMIVAPMSGQYIALDRYQDILTVDQVWLDQQLEGVSVLS
jgi:hypothetical protein